MTVTGKAMVAGVVGWPVSHSRSPVLHGHWLKRHGIDGAYVPLPVPPQHLPAALRALPALGFRGVNVTVPHKMAALAICDEVDALARRIGAVNTIRVADNDRLVGSNTDGFGLTENLHLNSHWKPSDGIAVIIGAGGAARAACVALMDSGVPGLRIVNRTAERATALAEELGDNAEAVVWGDRASALAGAALLVNTTSLGLQDQPPLDLPLDALPRDALVNDIVYAPLETPLLAAARAAGNPVVDGLGMLLHQARPGFEAWFGVPPEVDDDLRQAVLADLAGR